MMYRRRTLPVAVLTAAAVASLAVLNLSCGGGSPSSSTPATTLAPTPTPTTTTAPPAATCRFGRGVTYPGCERTVSQLLPAVESAMDRLIKEKPGIFDLSNEYAPGTRAYKVLDKVAYMNGLVSQLVGAGLCAERDIDDAYQQTLRVKDSNDFSEDFDVLLDRGSQSFIRRGNGSYAVTCTPPNFPADRPPDAPPPNSGCYRPFPPPLYKLVCRDYMNAGSYHIIDSTPWVANAAYCAAIGYTDGRGQCAVRLPSAIDRVACEEWIVGTAKDTGLPGPTWTKTSDGSYCTGKESGCAHSPDSKFQLWVYEHGYYRVSGNKGGEACDAYVDR